MQFKRKDLLAAGFLIFLTLIFYFEEIFSPLQTWPHLASDLSTQYRAYFAAMMGQGFLPLWNPEVLFGLPLVGDLRGGLFYPPNLIFFLFKGSTGLGLLVFVHHFMAGLFMYLLLRRLGCRVLSAFIAGSVFTFSGFFVAQDFHANVLFASTWLPLTLLLMHFSLERDDLRLAGLTGGVLALSFLAGAWDIVLGSAVFLLGWFYWVNRRSSQPRRWTRDLKNLGGIFLVFLLLSMIQLLPLIEASHFSGRNAFWALTRWPGVAGFQMVNDFFFPHLGEMAGPVHTIYSGILTLCLAGCAWFSRRDHRVQTFGIFVLLGIFLSQFAAFNFFGLWVVFGLAACTGFGLDRLTDAAESWEVRKKLPIRRLNGFFMFCLMVSLCFWLIGLGMAIGSEGAWNAVKPVFWAAGLLTASALLMLQRLRMRGEGLFFGLLILALLTWDIFQINRHPQATYPTLEQMNLKKHFQSQPQDYWAYGDLSLGGGKDAGLFNRLEDFSKPLVFPHWQVGDDPADLQGYLKSPARTPVVWSPGQKPSILVPGPAPDPGSPMTSLNPKIFSSDWQKNVMAWDVQVGQAGLLVLPQAYFPGWQARLNGSKVPVFRVNGFWQGLMVTPGRQTIGLTYRPWAYRWGKYLTLTTLMGLAIYLLHPFTPQTLWRAFSLGGLRQDVN